ncbi:MAG: hypothetical protein NDJ89_09050 [Oligoflexia bacterium]|nr:hypothetical protein [Oligoflexia bacterium]
MNAFRANLLAQLGFVLLSWGCPPSWGAEVDNFTDRDRRIRDSAGILDDYTNRQLAKAAAEANAKGGCAAGGLHAAIHRLLGEIPFGDVEKFAESSDQVERITVPVGKSLYRDAGLISSMTLRFGGGMASSIRVSGQLIGTDKLGHFFSEGYDYFVRGRERVKDALDLYGRLQERSGMGLGFTGVNSYADLAANFAGLRFYRNLVSGETPYFRCEGGRYVPARDFRWRDFVTEAWDEGLNCSTYTSEMEESVREFFQERKTGCPVDDGAACRRMAAMPCSYHFVNPECRKSVPSRSQGCVGWQALPVKETDCASSGQSGSFDSLRQQVRTLNAPVRAR